MTPGDTGLISPGSGRFQVPGPPAKVNDTAPEPDPNETRPVSVTTTGSVAGGSGVDVVI